MTKANQDKMILDRDARVLREVAKPVNLKDIGTKDLNEIITKMKKALQAEEDGVAIAAPQIGEGLQMFVVSKRAVEMTRETGTTKDMVFINPQIIKTSRRKKAMEEGCLSVRWLYGEVMRYEKITITAYDEKGSLGTYGASGLMAQIFQHEIDHLNGILFIDKAKNVRDLPPDDLSNK